MSPKHFPTLSIAAAALATLAVAGCGDDKKADTTTSAAAPAPAAAAPGATTPPATTPAPASSGAQDPVALAAATTDRQSGAVAFAMTGTVTTKGQSVPLSAHGTVDRKTRRGVFTTKTTVGPRSFTMQEITDKEQIYLRSSLFAGKLPGGKSWMRIDLAEAARTPGVDLATLGAGGPTQDPAQGLDYLRGAGAAKRLGTAKVKGVATTHYRVKVDLKRAADRGAKATVKRSIDQLITTLGGSTTIPVDVWIDGDHLVRRLRVAYSATAGGQVSKFDLTTDYPAFGTKIEARPPADSETFDGLESLRQAAKAQQEAHQTPQG